jgi:hypothetical protein
MFICLGHSNVMVFLEGGRRIRMAGKRCYSQSHQLLGPWNVCIGLCMCICECAPMCVCACVFLCVRIYEWMIMMGSKAHWGPSPQILHKMCTDEYFTSTEGLTHSCEHSATNCSARSCALHNIILHGVINLDIETLMYHYVWCDAITVTNVNKVFLGVLTMSFR